MRALIVIFCALWLSGCGASLSPSQLEPPAKVLMQPSPALATPKEGDDLVQDHIKLRRQYVSEVSKYRRLQRYVRTITGK